MDFGAIGDGGRHNVHAKCLHLHGVHFQNSEYALLAVQHVVALVLGLLRGTICMLVVLDTTLRIMNIEMECQEKAQRGLLASGAVIQPPYSRRRTANSSR